MLKRKYWELIANTGMFIGFLIKIVFPTKAQTGKAALFLNPFDSVTLSAEIKREKFKCYYTGIS
jgi:hypothetical protein